MSRDDIVVCENCGVEQSVHSNMAPEPPTEFGEDSHDWSDADPLDRLRARAEATRDVRVDSAEDNESFQFIDVVLTGDVRGDSEHMGDAAREEGFRFAGAGVRGSGPLLTFNRPKG